MFQAFKGGGLEITGDVLLSIDLLSIALFMAADGTLLDDDDDDDDDAFLGEIAMN